MIQFQIFLDAFNQGYVNLTNLPQIQPVIFMNDRTHEVVNINGFTPQAIEEVNRATALIDAYENRDSNSTKEDWESDETREDFIDISSLLAHNYNNPNFT